jgi:dihydrofolate reductase
MARIVGYIATSVDGFIATPQGTLEWLTKYDMDLGEHSYSNFIKGIRTVVMGRDTYAYLEKAEIDWPYDGKRNIVVTSRPLPNPEGELELWSRGVDALIESLRGLEDGDVWMVGGGRLQMAFIERGALDEIEIFMVPELIGGGIPLFPPTGFKTSPKLIASEVYSPGCVRLNYSFN